MARKLKPVHPGEILHEEFMKPLGLSMNKLALDLRVPVTRVADIVSERRGITAITPRTPRLGPAAMAAGALAAVGLLGALVLPARVATLTPNEAAVWLPTMQTWLIIATMVYLVAGTVFSLARYGDE